MIASVILLNIERYFGDSSHYPGGKIDIFICLPARISFIMRPENDKPYNVVRIIPTVSTQHDFIVLLLTTGKTIKIYDQKGLFDRATVEASEITFQRLSERKRVLNYHIHFLLYRTFYRRILYSFKTPAPIRASLD